MTHTPLDNFSFLLIFFLISRGRGSWLVGVLGWVGEDGSVGGLGLSFVRFEGVFVISESVRYVCFL